MKISLVAAMGKNRELGKDNRLLWHISEDLKNFKKITLEKPILMGRKTFESIGRALPKRVNIILTRDQSFSVDHPDVKVIHSLDQQTLEMMSQSWGIDELMVIGGGEIYRQFLPLADSLYLSRVEYSGQADTFFPEVDFSQWQLVEGQDFAASENKDGEMALPWRFEIWQRLKS